MVLCRKGMSTENLGLRLTDSIFKFIDKKMHDEGIFWDLVKASVCMNYEILLAKLHFYGI